MALASAITPAIPARTFMRRLPRWSLCPSPHPSSVPALLAGGGLGDAGHVGHHPRLAGDGHLAALVGDLVGAVPGEARADARRAPRLLALVAAGAERVGPLRAVEAGPGLEEVLLGGDQALAAVVGEVQARPQGDRLGGARLGAVAAVDAAHQVDLVADGIALAGRHGVLRVVLGGADGDAAHRAGAGAELAADALLHAVVVAVQDVAAAVAGRGRLLLLRPLQGDRLAEHVLQGERHALDQLFDHRDAPPAPGKRRSAAGFLTSSPPGWPPPLR